VMSSTINKKVEKLKEQFKASQEKIYHMNDVIKEKAFHLKHDQARNKALRVAQARNKSHHAIMDTDRKNRPSDRDFEVRMYSKMDLDVWKYEDVRQWFNTYASSDPSVYEYKFNPSETGYTIRVD